MRKLNEKRYVNKDDQEKYYVRKKFKQFRTSRTFQYK
jgi:hypothetical protein